MRASEIRAELVSGAPDVERMELVIERPAMNALAGGNGIDEAALAPEHESTLHHLLGVGVLALNDDAEERGDDPLLRHRAMVARARVRGRHGRSLRGSRRRASLPFALEI